MEKVALCISDLNKLNQVLNKTEETLTTEFIPRSICENENNNFIQIIPYVIFYNIDFEKDKLNFIIYKRANKITEERLQSKISVGFGGHIDKEEDIDASETSVSDGEHRYVMNYDNLINTCFKAAQRELQEELSITLNNLEEIKKEIVFFRNEDKEVDRVHLCCLIPVPLTNEQFESLKNISTFNKEEIEEINQVSLNLKDIFETYDISVVTTKITETLIQQNYESWGYISIIIILRALYFMLMTKIKYEDMKKIFLS